MTFLPNCGYFDIAILSSCIPLYFYIIPYISLNCKEFWGVNILAIKDKIEYTSIPDTYVFKIGINPYRRGSTEGSVEG